jgi:hypothetical protein
LDTYLQDSALCQLHPLVGRHRSSPRRPRRCRRGYNDVDHAVPKCDVRVRVVGRMRSAGGPSEKSLRNGRALHHRLNAIVPNVAILAGGNVKRLAEHGPEARHSSDPFGCSIHDCPRYGRVAEVEARAAPTSFVYKHSRRHQRRTPAEAPSSVAAPCSSSDTDSGRVSANTADQLRSATQ